MAHQYIDMSTLRFQLNEVHELANLMQRPYFKEHDVESMEMFLSAVKDFSDQELYPCFREMDEKPAYYQEGKIMVHPQIGKAMQEGGEMGLIRTLFKEEDGGLQMPLMVHTAAYFIMEAANNNVPGYLGLTYGAAELIVEFGDKKLQSTYVPNMQDGKWAGTMCLTEPQAGSSLSDVVTSATPAEGGHYKIKGQKIFISGGDHEYVENVVHLVLARIEGAPAGTKGISLFVIPKKRINGAGQLEWNDVTTAGDFQKMGQKGYCTTHIIFGEKDECQGWLVGEPNKGLKYMFQMMNGARIAVGRGAAAIAMAAYHAALNYANERPQGRKISSSGKKNVSDEQTLIINHPDVRRMLLLQKTIAEGGLSIVLQASQYYDLMISSETDEEKEKYQLLLELLTPIVKTFPSEKGIDSTSNGIQVLGGYGFCSEYILQQYFRDIRIFAIYEGTTGIQSLDLLGRKMTMANGKAATLLAQEINKTLQAASTFDELKPYAKTLGLNLKGMAEVMEFLMNFAQKGEFERFLSDANVFMDYMSTIVIGWQWLKIATMAKQLSVTGNTTNYSQQLLDSKVHAMQFYYKYEMSKTQGLAQTLMDENVLTIAKGAEIIV